MEIKEEFCECDILNVISFGKPVDVDKPISPAGCLTVSVWIEPKCKIQFHREGDGIIEAIDTSGNTDLTAPLTWVTRTLDSVRLNTLPAFMQFIDSEDCIELKNGIYKINYQSGVLFDQSVNIGYEVKLQESIDGGAWVDIPQSGSVDYALGVGGNVDAGRTLTYEVVRGSKAKLRIQEKITADTSIQSGGAGAGIVIERIKNSIDL